MTITLSEKKTGEMNTKKMSYANAMLSSSVATLMLLRRITPRKSTTRHTPKRSCSAHA